MSTCLRTGKRPRARLISTNDLSLLKHYTLGDAFSYSSETQADSKGGRRTTNGVSSTNDAFGSVTAINDHRNGTDDGASRQGRYQLKGCVLEIKRDDGQLDRHFVTFPNADERTQIDIDSDAFDLTQRLISKNNLISFQSVVKRYELIEGSASKYWEVSVDGATLTACYGRIGAQGQGQGFCKR